MNYAVVYERAEHNYAAYVPDLPGCVATGETLDECRRNNQIAIQMHVQGMIEDKQEVPEGRTLVEMMIA